MVKLFDTCVDDTLQHLSVVEKHRRLTSNRIRYRNMKMYQGELRMYRMFLWCIPDAAVDADLLSGLNSLAASILELYKFDPLTASFALKEKRCYLLVREVERKSVKCNAEVSKIRYFQHLMSSFSCEAAESSCLNVEFLDSLHAVLDHVLKDMDKSLVEKVLLLRDLIYYTTPQTNSNFQSMVNDWANKAASFSLLQGLYGIGKEVSRRLQNDLQQMKPDFIKFCFQVIKVPKMKHKDRLLFGEFASRFVDFFLDNLLFVLNDDDDDDDVGMVREGLIFIITFLADPPSDSLKHTELVPLVREQICAVLDQVSDNMCRGNTIPPLSWSTFLKPIDEVRGDIVDLYFHIPPLSWSTYPKINKLGFFESLLAYLEDLKETMNNNSKLVPFLKHQIFTIHQELLPLRSLLIDISEQIMSLLCQADFAIKSSFFIDNSIWYNLTFLSFLVRKIKDIQSEVKKIEFETQIEGSDICTPLMSSIDVHKPSTSTSNVEVVVGFEKEANVLIDRLVCGSAQLDIVPIVGMGGIGKTTLAKKLYNEMAVKNHFYKRAFCSVSQVYRKRNVLLAILTDLSPDDDTFRQMSVDDLAQRLRQSLLGCRYLIVVDDIWDINVWDDLKPSFPNNSNGSRIIFTTRIINLSNSTPCPLPFLSVDESWELLQQKVFHKDPCPPRLLEVGKVIAKNCKGLPLSIVVIAGLLRRTERSLVYWKEVAATLSSFAFSEGCKDIIKVSYNHLPDALKSCFLYLGAFPEDKFLVAGELAKLWVAEGFVLKSEGVSLYKIAKNYLKDLVDRNLVTVIQRSCNGGISTCRVHDLIRDFCRSLAQEENHLHYISAHNKNFLMSRELYQHRISVEGEWRPFVNAEPRCSTVHSLLFLEDCERNTYHCDVKSLQYFLRNFKLVQVLNLLGIIIDGVFPMTITKLVHLRYLALNFLGADVYVPTDIINLWNLETLRFTAGLFSGIHTHFKVEFPMDIWKMKRLKHVDLRALTRIALDNVRGDVSLLPDLISFGFVFIPYGEEGGELLRRLSNVRKFTCHCSGMWDPDRECNKLPKLEILTKLDSLSMVYVGEAQHPYMFSFPSTLRKLTLKGFSLPWNEFSAIIGMLPCLQVLVLDKNSFSGKRWNAEGEQFPMIKTLKLKFASLTSKHS